MYLSVLLVSVLVSLLGMSALVVKRVQRRNHQAAMDASQARFIAQSALRIGMLNIENDSNWRYNFPNGTWEEDVSLMGGTYTLEAYDPSDGDLSDNPEEPVVLIATGTKGAASQKTQLTLSPVNRGYEFLEKALVSQGDATVETPAVVYSNQILATNGKFCNLGTSSVTADVESNSELQGTGTYYGTTETGVQQEDFPDVNDILSYYLARGTAINYNDIQDQAPNLFKNSTFESGIDHWTGDNCDLNQSSSQYHSGAASLRCSDRDDPDDCPTYDLTDNIQSGQTYTLTFWAKSSTFVVDFFKVILETDSTTSGVLQKISYTSWMSTNWTKYTVTFEPTWTGTLTRATLRFETNWDDEDFRLDDLEFRGPTPTAGTIYKRVISPNHNPYGDTNPEGIYIIDCDGGNLYIESCRILGTLVILDPGNNSQVNPGPLAWSAFKSNYPCLLVDDDFKIKATNDGLNETRDNVNYNPIGAAHTTLGEDSDITDIIPSKMNGLIYVDNDLSFENQNNIEGVVLCKDKLDIAGTFSLVYNSIFFTNPLPVSVLRKRSAFYSTRSRNPSTESLHSA
ncbi:MAG: carbohydrate binding domain-containing protein [Planctomycetaceae bacterium]